ncbi:tRNA adenosine(34) deaminase TadA [Colwellia sp. MB02u-10]|uniref:tRNA adenosine(34) deaminase TadA n=1 Tax=Colwellia sp. MB02u-10 TaxID=2759828 RepID=UPI0015F48D27|nr:tRNA adenosine(34) deaminase TadA [Colwellia sp. MB02u-10]MBA6340049.1 tRNA adenosine(34) deaminase TadA [Colwellia sp. MB02u-10]
MIKNTLADKHKEQVVSKANDDGFSDDSFSNDDFSNDDRKFMHRAIELAKIADSHDEIPVGAVVVCAGEIVGEGFNQSIMNNDPSAHAEMMAIRDAGKNLQNYRLLDCTLYVTLEPCPMCAGLLVHSRIKRLVFASHDLKTGAASSAFSLINHEKHNHQVAVTAGLLADECSTMLSSFFKRRRAAKKAEKQAAKKALRIPE